MTGSPARRLRRWLELLIASKRRKALEDPELFATYVAIAAESREVVQEHVEHLVEQLRRIIADEVARGEFDASDPNAAASHRQGVPESLLQGG